MKLVLLLILMPSVIPIQWEVEYCWGVPIVQDCTDEMDNGHQTFSKCYENQNPTMWWFNVTDGKCAKMMYNGCGGNPNRYCSKQSCLKSCAVKFQKKNKRGKT